MGTLKRTSKYLVEYLIALALLGAAAMHAGFVITGLAPFRGWYWPSLGYGIMLAFALACYAFKPEDARQISWLVWHFLIPPGLLGIGTFSNVAGKVLNDLAGQSTLAGDFLIQVVEPAFLAAACTIIAALAGLALLEIVLRGIVWLLNRELGEDQDRPSLFEPVFEFFDKLWLTEWNVWVPASNTLELKYEPSKARVADEVGMVIPKAFRRSISGAILMLLLGGTLTLGLTVFPPVVTFVTTRGNFGSVRFAWFAWPVLIMFIFLALASMITLGTGTVLWQYLISEWNRRNDHIISFRDTLYRVWLKAPGGTPYFSESLTARMTSEAKAGSAGELTPEKEASTFWGQIWDGMFLWSGKGFRFLCSFLGIETWEPPWERVAMCFYPTAKEGGGDQISHVDWADTTKIVHKRVGAMSRFWGTLESKGVGEGIGKLILDPDRVEVPIYEQAPDVMGDVDTLQRLYFRRQAEMTGHREEDLLAAYGTNGRIVNLLDPKLKDPGRWDRRNGQPLWQAQV